jgi:hypothetical protein
MRLRSGFAFLVFAAMVFDTLAAATAFAAPPVSLAWHKQMGGNNMEAGTAVAASNGMVFTAGGSDGDFSCYGGPYYSPNLNCKLTVWANNLSDGTAAWAYKTPGRAEAVAAANGMVFVAGAGVENAKTNDFRVVALNQSTGNVMWSNGTLPDGTIGGEAFNVIVSGNTVYAVGCIFTGTGQTQSQFFIRAYDSATGNILWEQRGDPSHYQGVYFGLAAANGEVVASGGGAWNFLVRAYDASSGQQLWAQEADSGFGFDQAKSVSISGKLVLAVGEFAQQDTQDGRNAYAAAYDLGTGTTLWSKQIDTGGFDIFDAGAAGRKGLYAGGLGGASCIFWEPSDCPLATFSLDPATGSVVWQDYLDTTGVGEVTSMAVSGKYLYMTGQGGPQCSSVCEVVLRIYRAKDGKAVFTKTIDFHGADNTYPALVVAGGYLLLVGSTQTKAGDYDAFVSAYQIADGGQ